MYSSCCYCSFKLSQHLPPTTTCGVCLPFVSILFSHRMIIGLSMACLMYKKIIATSFRCSWSPAPLSAVDTLIICVYWSDNPLSPTSTNSVLVLQPPLNSYYILVNLLSCVANTDTHTYQPWQKSLFYLHVCWKFLQSFFSPIGNLFGDNG